MREQPTAMPWRSRLPSLTSCALSLLLAALPAHAEEDPCLASVECRSHYERARQHSRDSRLAEALVEYQAAYEAAPSPGLIFNIGRLHHRLGNLAEAATYYERYLTSAGADQEGKQRAQALLGSLAASAAPPVRADAAPAAPVSGPAQSLEPAAAVGRQAKSHRTWRVIGGILGGLAATGAVVVGAVLGARSQAPSIPDGVELYTW